MWEAPASLKRCIEVILRIELKQGYCEFGESVPAVLAKLPWNFHLSLSGCSTLAENDNISPVPRYLIEKWPALIACTWKNWVPPAAFCQVCGTKYGYSICDHIWASTSLRLELQAQRKPGHNACYTSSTLLYLVHETNPHGSLDPNLHIPSTSF